MNDLEIKRHSFELAKNRLKEFSKKTESELAIDKVQTDGGFLGLGDHKVTGYELNRRLETIHGHFIAVNATNNKVIKEFREVYNALDVLDKDYITSIVANVKAIEKTSNDVRTQQETLKQHNEKLANQQNKLDAHQTEIEKNVANISKIVTALNVFKEKLESYSHLTDIDKIWNDCQKWHREISELSTSLSSALLVGKENTKEISEIKQILVTAENKFIQLFDALDEQRTNIEALISMANELEAITHLKDIDAMWDSLTQAHTGLDKLHQELDSTNSIITRHQQELEDIIDFIGKLSKYEHLKDVDTMWSTVEEHGEKLVALAEKSDNTDNSVKNNQTAIDELKKYRQELSSISHLKDVDNLWNTSINQSNQIEELQNQVAETQNLIQYNKEIADQSLAFEKEKTDVALQKLNKKLQYAYWIAGGAMVLALVELLVILLG